MLRLMSVSAAAVALLFVTSTVHAQSGSRAAPAVPAFSAPVQSAPVIGGSGTSFGARQTFSQPAPVASGSGTSFGARQTFSQPAPVANGSGTVVRSTAPTSVLSGPQVVYSQPGVVTSQPSVISSSGCCSSPCHSAPVFQSAPVIRYSPLIRRSCGCGGF